MMGKLEQELNEYLAKEILGLEKKEVPYISQGDMKPHQFVEAWCDDGGSRYEVPTFDPLNNLEQAFEVLEEYCEQNDYYYTLFKSNERYQLSLKEEAPEDHDLGLLTKAPSGMMGETKEKTIIKNVGEVEKCGFLEEFEEVFE